MSKRNHIHGEIDFKEMESAVLEMDQERLLHMKALGIVLRLIEVPSSVSSEDELYKAIVKIVAQETDMENVSLLLYRPQKEILELVAAIGINQIVKDEVKEFDRRFNKGLFFKKGKSIAWEVFDSQQPIFINDDSCIEIPLVENAKNIPRSLACLPVSSKGILNLSSSQKIDFSNSLKRNLIIISQVIAHLVQGYKGADVVTDGHFYIQNLVESNNRANGHIDHEVSLNYLRAAMENAPQGVCLLNADSSIIHANPALCNLMQIDEAFLKDYGFGRFFMDASVFLEFTKATRSDEFRKISQIRLVRPDGTTVLADFFYHPVKSKEGKKLGGVLFVHDLSKHLQDSEQRIKEEKLRALGSMAAGIAHDFNNLLMAILGNVELLQMELEDERHKKRLQNIEKCVNDGAETIKRIQAFVKGKQNGQLHNQAIDTGAVIEEAVQFTRPLWKDECEKKGIYISIETELDRSLTANIAAYELREVLINLIINAVDAMPHGGKIFITSYKKDGRAIIEVRDTGTGMEDDVIPHIFDPYFSTKDSGSSGLGLSIVYGLVSNAGGKVDVVSQKGCGSTFIISLPSSNTNHEGQREEESDEERDTSSLRIMAVDDEEQIVELIGLMLKNIGHEVQVMSDPKEALSVFKKEHFDLVLTDLGMPGISGWEIAKTVKEYSPETFVVIMTGWGESFKEKDLKAKGIDALLAKPFRLDNILEVISSLFRT